MLRCEFLRGRKYVCYLRKRLQVNDDDQEKVDDYDDEDGGNADDILKANQMDKLRKMRRSLFVCVYNKNVINVTK